MKKILVPIDGSDASKRALDMAVGIAEKMDCIIKVINVIPPIVSQSSYSYSRTIDRTTLEEAMKISNKSSKDMIEEALLPYKDFAGEISSTTIIGNPVEEIIREAEGEKYSLIVMGSRGLGAFSRTLLGSVSDKVVHLSEVSVLIAK
ncbi:MAG: universal stress protein [Tissierellia bacterium]|nr:universal stress protein [Tissierellia bacterium]MDD4726210.1 universal stress protein [Tissierellia bacterium]